MKKITYLFSVFFVFVLVGCNSNQESKNDTAQLKKLHAENLAKSPFTEQLKLSKTERKEHRLTPNKYNEEMWELTMNPELGRPTPEKVSQLQKELLEQRAEAFVEGRVPGDAMDNGWVSRGPNNVGGRTRAVMFDPNDTSNNTVFAGGVSGGLWRNSNISSASTVWERVGIPENLAVSVIVADPNDSQIFYVGTGESYGGGDATGDGVWQSTDGGSTWTRIFGESTGDSYFVSASSISVNSPASIAGDYQSFATTAFGTEITTTVSGDLILANDPSPVSPQVAENGCNGFGPSASGKVALIRRGNCDFDIKVKNAEIAGAIAVIMMNNVAGEPVPMGGDDTTIGIPSVMISKEDGDAIEAALASGTVSVSLNPASGDFTATVIPGVLLVNDIIVVDNNGTSDIYVAAGDGVYSASNATTSIGGETYGIYKSSDEGANWSQINMPLTADVDGHKFEPNDLDYDAAGTIWVATNNSTLYGDGGGTILSSTDNGATFNIIYTVTNGVRTQIAASKTTANKVYLLAELSTGGVTMKYTTSGFFPAFFIDDKALPNDADPSIEATDFPRLQAWYNLYLSLDPNNDNVLYTGGIDLFKTTNGASSWTQLSHWYGGFGKQYVHADQHIAVFAPGDSNKVLFGNDGGVYYSSNGGVTIEDRNNGFVTSQFYTVGVGPTTAFTGDYFAGGLQDNGTQLFQNANPTGTDSSSEPYGGDGAYTFFDQDGTDRYFIRNYVYNSGVNLYNFDGANVTINNESSSNGSFINPQALDSNLDILYSNYSSGTNNIIKRYSGIKSNATLASTNLTSTVELTAAPTALTVSPYTTTSSKLLVGTRLGDIILVENANTGSPTWTNLDNRVIVGSISDIEYGQSENEIFVTVHNYGVNNIWYSGDAGANWEQKDGDLPDLPVKAILQNPLNLEEVLIGTELGAWYTSNFSDASPTWTQAYNDMSNVRVLDIDLRDDNMVFVATHGRGVFSGQFTPDSLSIDENTENAFSIYPNPSNGTIHIKTTQNYGKAVAAIFDMNGRKVFSAELSLNQQSTIEANNLATGMYVLKIQGANFSHSEKLVIKK
ncbi:PA domain-containing protein [Lacinutrix himadriensis]|uniref:PA domain-containing protein n=1 Tax=Lacinutrix himadriensis TaxID=641549 RepID=UPI0006E18470|nr:PA domain-containing protein [Lacinutrix himadriensis]